MTRFFDMSTLSVQQKQEFIQDFQQFTDSIGFPNVKWIPHASAQLKSSITFPEKEQAQSVVERVAWYFETKDLIFACTSKSSPGYRVVIKNIDSACKEFNSYLREVAKQIVEITRINNPDLDDDIAQDIEPMQFKAKEAAQLLNKICMTGTWYQMEIALIGQLEPRFDCFEPSSEVAIEYDEQSGTYHMRIRTLYGNSVAYHLNENIIVEIPNYSKEIELTESDLDFILEKLSS